MTSGWMFAPQAPCRYNHHEGAVTATEQGRVSNARHTDTHRHTQATPTRRQHNEQHAAAWCAPPHRSPATLFEGQRPAVGQWRRSPCPAYATHTASVGSADKRARCSAPSGSSTSASIALPVMMSHRARTSTRVRAARRSASVQRIRWHVPDGCSRTSCG